MYWRFLAIARAVPRLDSFFLATCVLQFEVSQCESFLHSSNPSIVVVSSSGLPL
ncbi:24023_t:CDS:2 [Gigaspora margarita]|uniref:24023_t:CDS:1 n=1 Tax=Gigaspora margarita TaxID=4874 RepID=A0ABM8W4S6_GIGMA|nr:24023_t:CDS:2 [Gigaspora margarita]